MAVELALIEEAPNTPIRITRVVYATGPRLDIRKWHRDADGVLRETRRGISMPEATFLELCDVLQGIKAQLTGDGHDAPDE